MEENNFFLTAMWGGAMAGLSVDIALFPLDTVKTRLQSAEGLMKSGGFRGIYAGLGSVVIGSMPTAAVFFCTYESVKAVCQKKIPEKYMFTSHMLGASCGEVVGCLVRVPVEVVKQRAQTKAGLSSYEILAKTLKQEGPRGLYRGYTSTVIREVPFSFLQFPMWEYFKKRWRRWTGEPIAAWESGLCGSLSGALAAAITTPLDVAKTRIMLAERGSSLSTGNIKNALQVVYSEKGMAGLFAGILPRVMWISIGGFIFLGVYEKCTIVFQNFLNKTKATDIKQL